MRADLKQPVSEAIGTVAAVEIVAEESTRGYLLLSIDPTGTGIADTWHPTIEAAKAQAAFQYGVLDSDWK